jgi:hypothetical protein
MNLVINILTHKKLNEKTFNYQVLDHVKHYNFDIGYFSIQGHLKNSKIWNLKYENLIYTSGSLNDLK